MGDNLKQKCGQILAEGIKNETLPTELNKRLAYELKTTEAHANMIARTETMRAAHAGSYGQAKRDGMLYYIIDPRAEACKRCQKEYLNRVFTIDDTAVFPPLHPHCACIPIYYRTQDEAQGATDNIHQEIIQKRQDLTDKGLYLPPDGTGPLQPGAPGYKDPNR
jgi:SPP1 gp7 family putative phage head morphogenesis protein